jgi:hypothetical protein
VIWPEGLRRLLDTSARELIDVELVARHNAYNPFNKTPIQWALNLGHPESVDALMKAGCALDLGQGSEGWDHFMSTTSDDCREVMASNLAE